MLCQFTRGAMSSSRSQSNAPLISCPPGTRCYSRKGLEVKREDSCILCGGTNGLTVNQLFCQHSYPLQTTIFQARDGFRKIENTLMIPKKDSNENKIDVSRKYQSNYVGTPPENRWSATNIQ